MDPTSFDILKGITQPVSDIACKALSLLERSGAKLYEPIGIVTKAKAEGTAKKILAKADIEVQQLLELAKEQAESRQIRQQLNLIEVCSKANRHLAANAGTVDPDWAMAFQAEAACISDKEMQELWAKLLAGEMNAPGTFSVRALNAVKLLNVAEANQFALICKGSALFRGDWLPGIDETRLAMGGANPVSRASLRRLIDASLVALTPVPLRVTFHVRSVPAANPHFVIQGRHFVVNLPFSTEPVLAPPGDVNIAYGNVMLTTIGEELNRLVEHEGHPDLANDWLAAMTRMNGQDVIKEVA